SLPPAPPPSHRRCAVPHPSSAGHAGCCRSSSSGQYPPPSSSLPAAAPPLVSAHPCILVLAGTHSSVQQTAAQRSAPALASSPFAPPGLAPPVSPALVVLCCLPWVSTSSAPAAAGTVPPGALPLACLALSPLGLRRPPLSAGLLPRSPHASALAPTLPSASARRRPCPSG